MAETTSGWQTVKAAGNDAYKAGNMTEAIAKYSEALEAGDIPQEERAKILSNRAQCYLKQKENEKAAEDCTACLALNPRMVKALFRRAKAYEAMGRKGDALNDYESFIAIEPDVVEVHRAIRRLRPKPAEDRRMEAAAAALQKKPLRDLSSEDRRQLAEAEQGLKEANILVRQAKERKGLTEQELRRSGITGRLLDSLAEGTTTYKSVGRMFVRQPLTSLVEETRTQSEALAKQLKAADAAVEYRERGLKESEAGFLELIRSLQR